ncbi:hypothetical protein KFE25_010625 [Diacronema lutheri]|uniref:SSD domain-containing protein n=1 Tax=Diacronema lutheri TaxID=2081491 RepID=A0A8J5XB59_DIALT|nr:hypothetical protein KFE25_010625 [Diacronema lutheri]
MRPVDKHDGEDEIKVARITKVILRWPCTCMWTMLVTIIVLTIAVIGIETGNRAGFLDIFAIPWFNPKYETVVLRGLGFQEMQQDQYVESDNDRRARRLDDDEDDDEDQERSLTLFEVVLAYEDIATDNLLTKANVEKMRTVERSIMAVDWAARCRLNYKDEDQEVKDAKCAAPLSLLNYVHVDKDQHKDGCKDGFCLGSYDFCAGKLLGTNFSTGPPPDWGTFPCRSTVFDWRQATLADESEWDKLLERNLCSPGFETKFLLDRQNEDCDGEKDISTKYARSRYSIGYPLSGFKNGDDDRNEQSARLAGGIFGRRDATYGPALLASLSTAIDEVSATSVNAGTFNNRTVNGKTINVFLSEGVTGREQDVQFQGVLLSVLALVFVWAYIWFNVGSLFLALTGTFEIVASLPLAWFIWRFVLWQLRIDIFAFSLIIFLILCIGADDIFVFMDTWKASRSKPANISGSLETRLQWTYGQAASAMFTTTATTVLALLMTATSTIPFIASFGIFGALVVTMDYVLVISWFPVTVVVYTTYFEKGCWAKCCSCLPGCRVDATPPGEPVPERKSVIFIRDRIAPVFFKYRHLMFGTGMLLIVAMCAVLGVLYEIAEDFPDFYVPAHPFAAYTAITRDKFFTADDWKHSVTMVYGLDPDEPVTRSLNGQLTLDIQNEEELVRNFVKIDFNEDMQWKLWDDCSELRKDRKLVVGQEVYCLLNDLQKWNPGAWPYKKEKDLRKALEKYYDSNEYSDIEIENYAFYTGFVADGDEGIKAYWVSYNATIPKEAASGPASLKKWQNRWEEVADNDCAAPCYPHMNNPPISRPVSWEFMTIIGILEENVWSTMFSSVACAWVVLVIVTRNWWISSMVAVIIVAIMASVIATVFTIGYIMDIFVSTFVALTIGLAIDYSVHIAHFYNHAPGSRFERAQHAMAEIAVSVIGGAVTTIFAGLPLFAAPTATNSLFGFFIFFTSLWSLLLTFLVFIPALMIFGPENRQGTFDSLINCFGSRHSRAAVASSLSA